MKKVTLTGFAPPHASHALGAGVSLGGLLDFLDVLLLDLRVP